MIWNKKANSRNFFLFECTMGCKVAETIRNIHNTFRPRTANECQCSSGSKVLKGRWEHWRWGVQWLAIRSWQQPIQNSFEADSYKLHEKLLNNSMLTILQSSTLEANWKGENLDKGVPHVMSRPHQKKKKIVILKCCLLLFYTATTSHFSNRLWHGTKSGLFTVTSNDQLSGWTEKWLQSQTCTQKKGHGHCLVVCCWSDPL